MGSEMCIRDRAYIYGRDYVVPEDLFTLAEDVILHRVRLSYEALASGISPSAMLERLLNDML